MLIFTKVAPYVLKFHRHHCTNYIKHCYKSIFSYLQKNSPLGILNTRQDIQLNAEIYTNKIGTLYQYCIKNYTSSCSRFNVQVTYSTGVLSMGSESSCICSFDKAECQVSQNCVLCVLFSGWGEQVPEVGSEQ